jgi:membrane protein DedA with SNARE-associated domain
MLLILLWVAFFVGIGYLLGSWVIGLVVGCGSFLVLWLLLVLLGVSFARRTMNDFNKKHRW